MPKGGYRVMGVSAFIGLQMGIGVDAFLNREECSFVDLCLEEAIGLWG